LTMTFTDTDYTDFGPGFLIGISGVNGAGITTSKASFSAFQDNTDAIPAANLIGSFLNQTGLSYNNGGTFANPGGAAGSLTSMTVFNFSGLGTMQANFTISAVPEPASIVFLGTVLLGLTALFRKRQVKHSQVL
jgi:hypothetical protein